MPFRRDSSVVAPRLGRAIGPDPKAAERDIEKLRSKRSAEGFAALRKCTDASASSVSAAAATAGQSAG